MAKGFKWLLHKKKKSVERLISIVFECVKKGMKFFFESIDVYNSIVVFPAQSNLTSHYGKAAGVHTPK